MSTIPPPLAPGPIEYPESDGLPMAENTKQFEWIVTLAGNLQALFSGRPDVFVFGNQNWYPVEGRPDICAAPDVYAVFGRPKGHRRSYKQWEEGGIPMTVVFEVLSPKNTDEEMAGKFLFYEEYGVEEYYIYDPEPSSLQVFQRRGSVLARARFGKEFVSPRLRIRFDLSGEEMVVWRPDGTPFLTFEQLKAVQERDAERARAANQRADEAAQRADEAAQRADRAEANIVRMRLLTRKVMQGQASEEDHAELGRLLGEDASSV